MSYRIVINPEYTSLQNFVANIPAVFTASGNVIYSGRNELRAFDVSDIRVAVKSFKIPHLINRIVYSLFRKSKARRSYEYAIKLLSMGINTPTPIAYIEERKYGFFSRSYFINIYAAEAEHVREQMLGKKSDDLFLKELAAFISLLHKKGILHKDLSPGNILTECHHGENFFSIIDINRLVFKTNLSIKERYNNFSRLSEDSRVIAKLAQYYAQASGLDQQDTIDHLIRYSKKEK